MGRRRASVMTGIIQRLLLLGLTALVSIVQVKAGEPSTPIRERMAAIERRQGGRLGLAALDTATGLRIGYRSSERFALCSTFKFLLVAAILTRVDEQRESLDRPIPYGPADLLDYAPVTKKHQGDGTMTIKELCAASLEYSDNTAANLLLALLGGPGAVTTYARSLGDPMTRLDRNEPSLNDNQPNDARDTTCPASMLEAMNKILSGRALSLPSRRMIEAFLLANTTGANRLRAGIPPGWRVGDKTGTGGRGATNDIAVMWPPDRPPIFMAVYYSGSTAPLSDREAVLAEVGNLVATEFLDRSH
jgi:beta-lactamase class A